MGDRVGVAGEFWDWLSFFKSGMLMPAKPGVVSAGAGDVTASLDLVTGAGCANDSGS